MPNHNPMTLNCSDGITLPGTDSPYAHLSEKNGLRALAWSEKRYGGPLEVAECAQCHKFHYIAHRTKEQHQETE